MTNFTNIVDIEKRPPATEANIKNAEERFNKSFPDQYINLLKETNGFYSNKAHLYSTEILLERNQTYNVEEFCPEYFNIGDDAGGSAILIKYDTSDTSVYLVGHGAMDPAHVFYERIGNNLPGWLESCCPLEE